MKAAWVDGRLALSSGMSPEVTQDRTRPETAGFVTSPTWSATMSAERPEGGGKHGPSALSLGSGSALGNSLASAVSDSYDASGEALRETSSASVARFSAAGASMPRLGNPSGPFPPAAPSMERPQDDTRSGGNVGAALR